MIDDTLTTVSTIEAYREYAFEAADALGYDHGVKRRIYQAKSIAEIARVMTTARKQKGEVK